MKEVASMTATEARTAYDHAVRNLDVETIQKIEKDPHAYKGDSALILHAKEVYRQSSYMTSGIVFSDNEAPMHHPV